jgi:hypothetical protein
MNKCERRAISFLLVISTSLLKTAAAQTNTLSEEIQDTRAITEEFSKYVAKAGIAERDPQYVPWKRDLANFVSDATVIFNEANSVRTACVAQKIARSGPCDSASTRENSLLSYLSTPKDMAEEPVSYWNDPKSIRPQIENWNNSEFSQLQLKIVHYATSADHFKPAIEKAEMLRRKANESMMVEDWVGGFIFLRHSQMLMNDAVIRALREAYSR